MRCGFPCVHAGCVPGGTPRGERRASAPPPLASRDRSAPNAFRSRAEVMLIASARRRALPGFRPTPGPECRRMRLDSGTSRPHLPHARPISAPDVAGNRPTFFSSSDRCPANLCHAKVRRLRHQIWALTPPHRPNLGPNSADLGDVWNNFARQPPNLARRRPTLADFDPTWAALDRS